MRELVQLRARPEAIHIYHGHTVLTTKQDGTVSKGGPEGLFFHNTRLLSWWEHRINGQRLKFISASPVDSYSMLQMYLSPDIMQEVGNIPPEERGVVLRVSRFVGDGMHEDADLENYTQTTVNCTLSWDVEADFADLGEAMEGKRKQEAPVDSEWRAIDAKTHELTLSYRHEKLPMAVVIRFLHPDGDPRWEDGRVVFDAKLAPHEHAHFCVSIEPVIDGRHATPEYGCYAFGGDTGSPHDEMRKRLLADATRVATTNANAHDAWHAAVRDLASLPLYDGGWPEALTPAAGIPAYQALFGRDSLTASWQAASVSPLLMEASIIRTAQHIGSTRDDFRDELPGRVIQQISFSPLARLGLTPFRCYYGDYSAPAAFLIVLGQHYMWTGDTEFFRRHQDAAERVLAFLDGEADADRDGFIEYETRSPLGQKNQGWKDSAVAVVYEDGSVVPNPVATCELQGDVYSAKQQHGLAIALAGKQFGDARRLLKEASDLKKRFAESFWMPDEQFVALCLDPDKRAVRTIASNAAHCLATGIVSGDHAGAVAKRLLAADMYSGWGVRTLSTEHPSYNPYSYQLGSVWPMESANTAFGMARYGLYDEVNVLTRGLFDLAALFPNHQLPEVVGGYQRDAEHPHPGTYPQAETPQAWSASAVPMCVQSMLGLQPLAPLRTLLIDPALPEWMPDLTLSNLQVGDARVTIRFHREADGSTGWKIIEKRGTLFVIQQPSGLSLTASARDRAKDLATSIFPWTH